MADFKGPEAVLTRLKVALCRQQQVIEQAVTEVAVIGQQGVGQRQAPLRIGPRSFGAGGPQRQGTGLLQSRRHQVAPQPSLGLLGRREPAGGDRVGQVACEAVVAHQACHLFDQVHLPLQIHGP